LGGEKLEPSSLTQIAAKGKKEPYSYQRNSRVKPYRSPKTGKCVKIKADTPFCREWKRKDTKEVVSFDAQDPWPRWKKTAKKKKTPKKPPTQKQKKKKNQTKKKQPPLQGDPSLPGLRTLAQAAIEQKNRRGRRSAECKIITKFGI